MRLLLTRPIAEAERTAAALRARGHDALLAPMLTIENRPDAEIDEGPFAALLLTSGNAARALALHPRRGAVTGLRCFAVGRQTAQAARDAGFTDVLSADGDGGDLAQLVAREVADKSRPLLYLAGDDRARDMAAEIAPAGLRLETVAIYRAVAAKHFEAPVIEALGDGRIDGAMHYSRRTTRIFVDCARASGLTQAAADLRHFCLSARAAEPLSEIGVTQVSVAARRDEQAMLELIG